MATIKMDTDGLERPGVSSANIDYPSNSKNVGKEEVTEEVKKVKKVVTGRVVQKKKSLANKASEIFFGDNVNNVVLYVIKDVLMPAAKNTISDMVSSGIEMLLFGETRSRKSRNDRGNKPYTSYSSYYDKSDKRTDQRPSNPHNRAIHNFDDIILETRREADDVLDNLVEAISKYGLVSVDDLYTLVDIPGSFADRKYGWTELSTARVRAIRDGFLLDLPKARLLD